MSEKYLRQKIKKHWHILKTYRIENLCDPGMPDIFFLSPKGVAGWIELKKINSFHCKIKFQPAQPLWLHNYYSMGGHAFVLVYVVMDNMYILLSVENIINYSKLKLKFINETLMISNSIIDIEKELLNFESISKKIDKRVFG